MAHTLQSLQENGLIARVIGNNTGHDYEINDLVIVCQVFSRHPAYIYAIGTKTAQYFSEKDLEPVGQIDVPLPWETPSTFVNAYNNWLENNDIPHIQQAKPRTQKARGLRVLVGLRHTNQIIQLARNPISSTVSALQFPLFARPCPVKPRHGFVESRKVTSLDELNAVITETRQADPYGEVLLMKPIRATYSGIVTDNTVTIGRGTDGATSGTKSIAIPCMSDLRKALTLKTEYLYMLNGHKKSCPVRALRYASVRPGHAVFLETVGTQIVQLRTGPAVDYTQTWYSSESNITIMAVETFETSVPFLEYEQKLQELKAQTYYPASTVIHLPGQTLTSHYAVQAISRGFTVCTEMMQPILNACKSFETGTSCLYINDAYRAKVLHARAVSHTVIPSRATLQWAISVIQGLSATRHTLQSITLLVAAGSLLARTGIALCLGEHRHFWEFGPGRYRMSACAPTYPPFEMISCLGSNNAKMDRESFYADVFKLDWNDIATWHRMQTILLGVEYDFNLEGQWNPSYGGPKWGQCTRATLQLIQAMMPFLLMTDKKPGPSGETLNCTTHTQINDIIACANRLITLSHNSGKCLTKLIPTSDLIKISNGYTGIHIATSLLTWKLVK